MIWFVQWKGTVMYGKIILYISESNLTLTYYIALLKSKYGLPKVTKENSKSYQTVVSEF